MIKIFENINGKVNFVDDDNNLVGFEMNVGGIILQQGYL